MFEYYRTSVAKKKGLIQSSRACWAKPLSHNTANMAATSRRYDSLAEEAIVGVAVDMRWIMQTERQTSRVEYREDEVGELWEEYASDALVGIVTIRGIQGLQPLTGSCLVAALLERERALYTWGMGKDLRSNNPMISIFCCSLSVTLSLTASAYPNIHTFSALVCNSEDVSRDGGSW